MTPLTLAPTPTLCRGHMVARPRLWLETHFATLPNGDVLMCADIPAPTPHFGRANDNQARPWVRVAAVPEGAEFIGNYPVPEAP